ncbi:MAG: hypothetical protein AB7G24_12355 [Novosphingobium sp.]
MAARAVPGQAQEDAADDGHPPAAIELTPYVWAAGLQGDVSAKGVAADVRLNAADLASGARTGLMGIAKFRNRGMFIQTEIFYLDFADSSFDPFFNQATEARLLFVESGIGIERKLTLGRTTMQVAPFAGVQLLSINTLVKGAGGELRADGSWVSPSIGLTADVPLANRVTLLLKADAAGFGLDDADYRHGFAGIAYELTRNVRIIGGYRMARGDMRSGPDGLSVDLKVRGPAIGLQAGFGRAR